ncbi:MAG: tetratricopeptide repeat protein [Candidatus Omnitrophota bacterium]
MNKCKRFLLLNCGFAFLLFTFTFPCYAASVQQDIKSANKLYQKGKLDEALQKYNEAGAAQPDSDIVNFNIGAALYKKEDYQKAQEAFTKALISGDRKVEADALYNLGNCKYKSGKLKENTDLSATVGLLRESLDYYKRAVEVDQKNTDARFNHEFVERELKVLLDKLKQQESNPDKQKKQQEQEQQKEQQKQGTCPTGSKQSADDKKENAESKQTETQRQEEKEKAGQGQSEKTEDQKQQEEGQADKEAFQQEGENKELSEEGARTILERYGREEASPDYLSADRQDMDKQTHRGYDSQVLKDW